jgi:hypothetical protein
MNNKAQSTSSTSITPTAVGVGNTSLTITGQAHRLKVWGAIFTGKLKKKHCRLASQKAVVLVLYYFFFLC